MNKLMIVSLAATALMPAALAAQTVTPPVRWQDTPDAKLNVPAPPARQPAPGVTWQKPVPPVRAETRTAPVAPPPPMRAEVRTAPMAAPPAQVRMHAGAAAPVAVQRHRERVVHRGGGHHRFRNVQRIERGGFVHHGWFGPQFHVRNWGLHGFPQPHGDRRWIRYYDDALLVDRSGEVHDGRYGLDWDSYGESWNYDRGVPEYVGDGDFYPDEEDYAYVEGADTRYAEDYDDERRAYGASHGSYGYAYPAYAYGCGCGTVTITETTVTEAPVVTAHTVYEYVRVPAKVHKRSYRAKPAPQPAKVRAYRGGEKG